jgi:hypothetical protein
LDGRIKDPSSSPQVISNKMKYHGSDPLADQISSFVNTVSNGSKPVVSGQDGRRALKFALTIIDQIENGCNNFQSVC